MKLETLLHEDGDFSHGYSYNLSSDKTRERKTEKEREKRKLKTNRQRERHTEQNKGQSTSIKIDRQTNRQNSGREVQRVGEIGCQPNFLVIAAERKI